MAPLSGFVSLIIETHSLVGALKAALGKLDYRKFRAVKLMNSLLSLSMTQT